ncbi:hypothetical protein [Salibacterium qingdaonense]|uniref:Uncharacterized protein n=1 Tax=Salibacterium qingdaonense TaxID=266892 RepID=A0A1I4P599_9BACI|nr:hypothetical protein [Salibacterium qingdaonense]SFM22533.1 hypothetical protein SAMN04488054_1235 [Salibacterium qingdaonense]
MDIVLYIAGSILFFTLVKKRRNERKEFNEMNKILKSSSSDTEKINKLRSLQMNGAAFTVSPNGAAASETGILFQDFDDFFSMKNHNKMRNEMHGMNHGMGTGDPNHHGPRLGEDMIKDESHFGIDHGLGIANPEHNMPDHNHGMPDHNHPPNHMNGM